jgi:polyphosphate kinase 2
MEQKTSKKITKSLFNTKKGLMMLLQRKGELDIEKSAQILSAEKQLEKKHVNLKQLQNHIVENGLKVIVVFEGRDAAGKGGAIRRVVEHLNPREYRVVALPKPDELEQGQWYFQRYVNHLPNKGEIVFFDRSWYNRAIVEPVNRFCTADEYDIFMKQVVPFEKMLVESGFIVIKFYLSITKDEQAKRFKRIKNSPLKKWKYSEVDQNAYALWDEYTSYKKLMFQATNTEFAPWIVVKANKKSKARLKIAKKILAHFPDMK